MYVCMYMCIYNILTYLYYYITLEYFEYICHAVSSLDVISHFYSANCSAGYYRNVSTNMCNPCPYGEYQTDKWQDQCISCMPIGTKLYSTNITGASSKDECIGMLYPWEHIFNRIVHLHRPLKLVTVYL